MVELCMMASIFCYQAAFLLQCRLRHIWPEGDLERVFVQEGNSLAVLWLLQVAFVSQIYTLVFMDMH